MSKPSSEVITEGLAALKGELRDFKVELDKALKKPTKLADYADSADKLEQKTPAQVSQLAVDEVNKHINKKGVNVHGLDPHTLGAYNKQEYDADFDLLMDVSSGVPLDFYGDREFLPPGVTGSYESGSNTTPWDNVAMMLEDNGTLMILRPGTDGDSAGVYYSYLRNAMTETDINGNLLMSNVEYRPAYFPDNMAAKAILSGTQDIICGVMKNKVTGDHTGYFISLTNNTMDMTKHTGIFVPNGNFLDVKGPFPGLYHIPFGFIKGNYVYILHDLHREGKIGHRVWRLNKNELITGNFTSATQIKGWTINRGVGGVVTNDDIVIFDSIQEATVNQGKPSTSVLATNGSTMGTAITRDNGNTGVMCSYYCQWYPGDNLVSVLGQQLYYSYEFNENKQIDVSKYHASKTTMVYDSTGWHPQASASQQNWAHNNHQRQQNGQSTDSIYSTVYNQLWLWTTVSYVTQLGNLWLHRFTYDEKADNLEVLAGFHDLTSHNYGAPVGKYGSPLTSTYRAVSSVGDDTVNVFNYGRLNGIAKTFYVRSKLIGEPTFQYSSVTGNFAWKGFAPTADRLSTDDLGFTDWNFQMLLNEGSPGVGRTSHGRFTSWYPDFTSRFAQFDGNMNGSGEITCPKAVMDSLQTQIMTNLGSRGFSQWPEPTGLAKFCFELVIPQIYTDMAPFVIGSIVNNADRSHHLFIYNVNISGSRQAITGASIIAGSFFSVRNDATVGTILGLSANPNSGQTAIRRVTGGFMVGFAADHAYHIVGNGGRAMMLLKCIGGVWSVNGNVYWDYWSGTAPAGWVNLPNRGLYYVLSSEFIYGEIDCGSKMIATLAAQNTPTDWNVNELRSRALQSSYGFIMLSQRVVTAWTVYFSDDTPAMLDGDFYIVKPLSYNLNPATDGNKTFHVWLVKQGSDLVYKVVATSTTPPAGRSLYLGYFTTTSTGLNSIQIAKRVAIDGNMISPDARGSSIPVTSGTPNTYGRLNWK